jgi:DNA-binding NarL/FixJ family response regulator
MLREGLADKEVAAQLGIQCVTVRTYVARLQEKLGAFNRRQLGALSLDLEDPRNGNDAGGGSRVLSAASA